jgi:hypothetical protein
MDSEETVTHRKEFGKKYFKKLYVFQPFYISGYDSFMKISIFLISDFRGIKLN